MGLNFIKNELIHVHFTSELKNFIVYCVCGKTWLYIVLHDFNLTYYSSIIHGSFSILLFPKLCWHIGLTPSVHGVILSLVRTTTSTVDGKSQGFWLISFSVTSNASYLLADKVQIFTSKLCVHVIIILFRVLLRVMVHNGGFNSRVS